MRSSPRRPLILKRRKLSLPQKDGAHSSGAPEQRPPPLTEAGKQRGQNSASRVDINPAQNLVQKTTVNVRPEQSLQNEISVSSTPEQNPFSETISSPNQNQNSTLGTTASCTPQSPCTSTKSTSSEIKVMGHPTIPDTQLVVLPPNSDMESIIQALTARGREMGGPNKFILISGSPSFHTQAEKLGFQTKAEEVATLQIEAPASAQPGEEEEQKGMQNIIMELKVIFFFFVSVTEKIPLNLLKTERRDFSSGIVIRTGVPPWKISPHLLPQWQQSSSRGGESPQ